MIKRTLFGIILLITTICSFSSCDEDPYIDPYQTAMDNLCIPVWLDEYVTNDGRDCEQELVFNYNFTGYEYLTYYYPSGATQEERIPFTWEWDGRYTDALYINYPDRDGIWLEDIRFGYNTMTCFYDDLADPVTFKAGYR